METGPTIQVETIVFIIYEIIDLLFSTDFINSGQAMVGPTYTRLYQPCSEHESTL